jgi:hypothetical protein
MSLTKAIRRQVVDVLFGNASGTRQLAPFTTIWVGLMKDIRKDSVLECDFPGYARQSLNCTPQESPLSNNFDKPLNAVTGFTWGPYASLTEDGIITGIAIWGSQTGSDMIAVWPLSQRVNLQRDTVWEIPPGGIIINME